jgi:hypothetical protein
MLMLTHGGCSGFFLVPEKRLGQEFCCPYDGCMIRLPRPPLRESRWLRRFREADWLQTSDLNLLMQYAAAWMSPRQGRLFAAACCRRIWHMLADERSQQAVVAAEDYADGVIHRGRLAAAELAARTVVPALLQDSLTSPAGGAYYYAAAAAQGSAALHVEPGGVAANVRYGVGRGLGLAYGEPESELAAQVSLVREFLGNPFRPVAPDPAVLLWNDGTIPRLAGATYDQRRQPGGTLDSERLAILADALEEAGCADQAILSHLREPGPHVRGCWAVDALLAME